MKRQTTSQYRSGKVTQLILFVLLGLIPTIGLGQSWKRLPNSPVENWRHDDLFFLNENQGWVCNLDGVVYHTRDGGENWTTLTTDTTVAFRCIGFADSLRGWVGNLGPSQWTPNIDSFPLYETVDGGRTWSPVNILQGDTPKGICGLNVVNANTVYAVGRVTSPPYLMKTADGGQTWISTDMSAYFRSLIDVYFKNELEGIIVGNTPSPDSEQSQAKIMGTSDGGKTWDIRYQGSRNGNLCWKISFPSNRIGYVSLESSNDSVYVLKTTDKGATWTEKLLSNQNVRVQGIGFIDEQTGWAGATKNFVTYDGGENWVRTSNIPYNFNRFRQVSPATSYAVGNMVWKYTDSTKVPLIIENAQGPDPGVVLYQNAPNPFRGKTQIKYSLDKASNVRLSVYDYAGRHLVDLVNEFKEPGTHSVEFTPKRYDLSILFYSITTDNYQETKSMKAILD